MDALLERLDTKLREWKPETAAQVRQRVGEIIDLADHDVIDVLRWRAVEQEVLDALDDAPVRFGGENATAKPRSVGFQSAHKQRRDPCRRIPLVRVRSGSYKNPPHFSPTSYAVRDPLLREKSMNDPQTEDDPMPPEIDFSKGVRGFHHIPATAKVFLPVID
jgi:hypothetical protein